MPDGRHQRRRRPTDASRAETAHRADRDVAAVQSATRRWFLDGARSRAPAPPAAPPSGACTGPPRPGGSPGGAGAAGLPSAPTASPPPPSCTRPRAGPSRAGARDAPRDGNAAHALPARRIAVPLGAVAPAGGGGGASCRAAAPAGRGAPAARTPRRDVRRAVSVEPCRRRATTRCAVVGGGPGGVVLAYLLARAGVPVTLLESRPDFDRRFRGDALAPPVLERARRAGAGASRCSPQSRTAPPTRSCGAPPPAPTAWPTTGARARSTRTTRWCRRAGSCRSWCERGRAVPRLPRRDGRAGSALLRDPDGVGRPRDRRRVHPRRGAAAVARGPGRRRRRAQLEDAHALDDHRHRAGCAPGHLLVRGAAPGRRPAAVRARADRRARRDAGGARPGRRAGSSATLSRRARSRRCARAGSGRWSARCAAGCRGWATGSTG